MKSRIIFFIAAFLCSTISVQEFTASIGSDAMAFGGGVTITGDGSDPEDDTPLDEACARELGIDDDAFTFNMYHSAVESNLPIRKYRAEHPDSAFCQPIEGQNGPGFDGCDRCIVLEHIEPSVPGVDDLDSRAKRELDHACVGNLGIDEEALKPTFARNSEGESIIARLYFRDHPDSSKCQPYQTHLRHDGCDPCLLGKDPGCDYSNARNQKGFGWSNKNQRSCHPQGCLEQIPAESFSYQESVEMFNGSTIGPLQYRVYFADHEQAANCQQVVGNSSLGLDYCGNFCKVGAASSSDSPDTPVVDNVTVVQNTIVVENTTSDNEASSSDSSGNSQNNVVHYPESAGECRCVESGSTEAEAIEDYNNRCGTRFEMYGCLEHYGRFLCSNQPLDRYHTADRCSRYTNGDPEEQDPYKVCPSHIQDTDRDGFGYYSGESCIMPNAFPNIYGAPPSARPLSACDHEGTYTEVLPGHTQPVRHYPANNPAAAQCVDESGDGWGWDGCTTCLVVESSEEVSEPVNAQAPTTSNDSGSCDYSDARQHNGWGWNSESGSSCGGPDSCLEQISPEAFTYRQGPEMINGMRVGNLRIRLYFADHPESSDCQPFLGNTSVGRDYCGHYCRIEPASTSNESVGLDGNNERSVVEPTPASAGIDGNNEQSATGPSPTSGGVDVTENKGPGEQGSSQGEEAPVCESDNSDPDGDGWGWEDGLSCRHLINRSISCRNDLGINRNAYEIVNKYGAAHYSASHPDARYCDLVGGDNFGSDGCGVCSIEGVNEEDSGDQKVEAPELAPVNQDAGNGDSIDYSSRGFPYCASASSDLDGDGWGWENDESCIVRGSAADN